MSEKYRTGIIGFGHMHINQVAGLYTKHPQVEWVACADTVPSRPELREARYTRGWNLKYALTELGVPKTYGDYREMLAKEKFDIVIVCSENAQHAEIVEACAADGIHVQVEKPMAASLSDALRIVRACRASGSTLVINWPSTYRPAIHKVKELIDEGAIGRVLEVKFHSGHTGPLGSGARHAGVDEEAAPMTDLDRAATWWHRAADGGGVMLDFCCYGACFARWYVGEQAVAALGMKANLNSQWGDAEDEGVILFRFPDAIGISEGGFNVHGLTEPTGPIVVGTEGTLVVDTHASNTRVQLVHSRDDVVVYEGDPLPASRQNVASEVIHHLETGDPLHPTIEMMFNLDVMAMLDAGIRSAASNKLEVIDSAAWHIG